MAFMLANPPSPSTLRDGHHHIDPEEWALSSAFRAAPFHSSSTPTTSTAHLPHHHHTHPEHDHHSSSASMSKEKERQRVEINLDSDSLFLKGTGSDVEPALLSGHVALYLAESTSIKEITLQFRGKARLPVPPTESISLNNAPNTFVLCNHEWSFLEGEKKHSHRLKAGRHIFPFQLQIGGSLPSTISTNAGGGASIIYKLRAHVARPGFSFNHSNLQAVVPVSVIRAFTPEALEYQQTLEIENTWPEKLMYSIMLPHKAWAAGDRAVAVVRFSPLAKGVRILNITSSLHETTKLYGRSGHQESTHPVASVIHEMVGGVAVEVTRDQLRRRSRSSPGGSPTYASTPSGMRTPPSREPAGSSSSGSSALFSMTPLTSRDPPAAHAGSSSGHATSSSSSSAHSSPRVSALTSTLPTAGPSTSASSSSTAAASASFHHDDSADVIETMDEITTTLHIPIPINSVTPTHALDPIIVSHRLRWSILIHNLDGHTSELRCSLPVHILDPRLLSEARQNTAVTRRVLLGDVVMHGSAAELDNEDAELLLENEEDAELPSYYSHVRDRVANMFLPEGATMRVTNPWVLHGVSPVVAQLNGNGAGVNGGSGGGGSYASSTRSGTASPYAYDAPHHTISSLSQLPADPVVGEVTPLDWVNSELLFSLSQIPLHAQPPQSQQTQTTSGSQTQNAGTPPLNASLNGSDGSVASRGYPFPDSSRMRGRGSGADSVPPSRISTRPNTRPPSPERHINGNGHGATQPPLPSNTPSTANETYVHSGAATRQMHTLTSISMKPLAALTHHSWLPSRSNSHTNLTSLVPSNDSGHTHTYLPFRHHSSHTLSHTSVPNTNIASFTASNPSAILSSSPTSIPPSSTNHTHIPLSSIPLPDAEMGSALLHRAFTEVPDYSVASRGFLGGVPPLSSMQGLPSYEEASQGSSVVGAGVRSESPAAS